ncbi:CP11A protein, partial [Anthoscopus minutus]|nr:CP11A protein [Anthoscopus minutus]
SQVPGEWRAGWLNLYRFWREGGLTNLHLIMARKFRQFGPIYREKLGVYESVNIISPGDAATLFQAEGPLPERFSVPPWVAYRDLRNKPYGVLLKSFTVTGSSWSCWPWGQGQVLHSHWEHLGQVSMATEDKDKDVSLTSLSPAVCHVLYGERLGLLQDFVEPGAQRFIEAVSRMFHTTAPMLYLPPALLRRLNTRTWRDHVQAWDAIFSQGHGREHLGVLGSLILRDKLALDDIRASVTEMMAGGVDTTSMTLQWALLELARAPGVQEQLRAEVLAAKRAAGGDREEMLKSTRLLKAAIKETLRLHPVAVTLQRYTTHEVILQQYRIPP